MRRSNHADVILLDIFERTTPSGPEPFFHVEVEHEVAATFQGGENTPKHLLQLVQTHHVIQAVKGRENRRKPAGQSEVAGVLDDEFHVRGVLPRYLDRPLRAVEARCQVALPRKLGGKLSGTHSRDPGRCIQAEDSPEPDVRGSGTPSSRRIPNAGCRRARRGHMRRSGSGDLLLRMSAGLSRLVPRCVPAAAPWLWAHLQRGPPLLP